MRTPLITIYKSFIGPHLDYGGIIKGKAHNSSFCQNHLSASNNRSYKKNFLIKTLQRHRIRISRKKTMVSKTLFS